MGNLFLQEFPFRPYFSTCSGGTVKNILKSHLQIWPLYVGRTQLKKRNLGICIVVVVGAQRDDFFPQYFNMEKG